jgi:hypothetical protein
MNRVSRKGATIGAAGLLALAGIGGVVEHNAAHAAGSVTVTQAAPDPDQVQQEVQSGSQQDPGGSDKAEPGASAAPDPDTIESQSQADTP